MSRTSELLLLGGSVVGLVLGTWLLPYRFPPSTFIAGASYEVGFNNQLSYLWYVGFLIVPVFLAARLFSWTAPAIRTRLDGLPVRTIPWQVCLVVVFHAVLFGAVYAYKGRFVFSEALYFQNLVYRMTLGEIPYLDFSFYYGPSMLYPAFWLTKFVELELAYALWFVASYLIGLLLLYVLVRVALGSEKQVIPWFVLLAIGLITPWAGLNVTFIRFLLPAFVLVVVVRYIRTGGATRFGLVLGSLTFALLFSFEVAALSVGGIFLLLVAWIANRPIHRLLRWVERVVQVPSIERGRIVSETEPRSFIGQAGVLERATVLLGLSLAICVACFYRIDPTGQALMLYPEIAVSYSSGAHNIPIYPNLPFLTLVAVTIFACGGIFASISQHSMRGIIPVLLALVVFALATQRAAFGVSEPSRFAFYGLPTLLLCLFFSRRLVNGARIRRWLVVGVVMGMALPMQYHHFTQFMPFFGFGWSVVAAPAPDSGVEAGGSEDIEGTLRDVVRQVGVDRPYLMYELDYYSFPVYQEFQLRYPMYFPQLINARTYEGMDRVISEVRKSGAIVVARTRDLGPGSLRDHSEGSEGVWAALDLVSGALTANSPIVLVLSANRARLLAPFLDFLHAEYKPLYEQDGIVALTQKSTR